jgi:CRP-like cAMP-binding protein
MMKGTFFKKYHLFVGLKEDELDKLAMRMEESTFKKKKIILREGEICPDNPFLYIIDKGEVSLIKKDSSREPQKIGVMEEGNVFGVENLVGRLRGLITYPLTYEAFSDVTVHTLSNEDLKQALSEEGYAVIALNVTRYLSRWMRACLERCATMEVLRGYLRVS